MDLIVIIFSLVGIALLVVLYKEIQKQFKNKPKLDRSLDRELLKLLGGSKETALRLLRKARKNHPGKSYLWYHEKVIRDLERDRRFWVDSKLDFCN